MGVATRQTVGGDGRQCPHSPGPSPPPTPPGLQNVATAEQRGGEKRKEPCLSGHKAKTPELDASPHVSVYIGNSVLGHVQKRPL